MIKLFFSYSHADDKYRDELQKHLMSLQYQGIVESWHDRRILAGQEWANLIDNELGKADIILLLVSSDFIASNYCMGIEMKLALDRHESNEAVVIPVILRSCLWQSLPFGKLQAATREGKPVEKYPSLDDAFLEITKNIETVAKRLTSQGNRSTLDNTNSNLSSGKNGASDLIGQNNILPRSSNLAIPRVFTDHDKDVYSVEAFDYLASFFEGSLKELNERNLNVVSSLFQRIDARSFEATIYKNGNQISKCGIWLDNSLYGSRGGASSIIYSSSGLGQRNTYNETLSIKDNGNILGLEPMNMSFSNQTKKPLTNQGAAEYYWSMLFAPMQRSH